MKVLLDTNVILDIALERAPYFKDAVKLFQLIDDDIITGNITATTVTDIYYIAKKEKGHEQAIRFLLSLTDVVEIIGVDKNIILESLNSNLKDFEDAIQVYSASFNQVEIIITRNKKDFAKASISVMTVNEFLAKVK